MVGYNNQYSSVDAILTSETDYAAAVAGGDIGQGTLGIAYTNSGDMPGLTPLYNLKRVYGGDADYYTTDADERQGDLNSGFYVHDGFLCYVLSSAVCQTKPLYRSSDYPYGYLYSNYSDGPYGEPNTLIAYLAVDPLHIDSGFEGYFGFGYSSGSCYTDSSSNVWNWDQGTADGGALSTTNAIANTPDPTLYQSQRQGASIAYSLPAQNGAQTLSLLFAEIDPNITGPGQRVFNVTANGQQILANYDIYADAGGANKAVIKTFPITIAGGTLNLTFTGVTGNAAVAAFSLVPASTALSPPDDLAAYATGSGKITLYWSGVSGATGYNIYRGTTAGGEDYANPINGSTPVTTLDTGPGVTNMYMYSDTGLTDGTEYFYTIKAVDGSTFSDPSNEDSDVPDAGNVPWDSGDPSAILSAFKSVFASDVQSAGEDGDYPLRVVGPDNVIYDYSNQTAQSADGTITTGTNQFVWPDGSSISLPDDLGEFDAPSGQEDMEVNPDLVGASLQPSYGPYRRVRTTADFRGEEGLLTLPSTFITQTGKANGDTACIYVGASTDNLEVDAGLVYSTAHSNWGMFMNINGKPVQPGGKGISPVHLLNIPKASSVRFPANDTVQVDYWAWGYLPGMTRTKLSLLLADDSLYGSGIRGGLGATSKYLGHSENIRANRVHAIAQTLPVKSVAPTGSSMEGASWMQGEVWLPNAYPTLQGWSSADGTHTPPQEDGSYDGGNSSVNAYETSPYIAEDNIDIDIDISP